MSIQVTAVLSCNGECGQTITLEVSSGTGPWSMTSWARHQAHALHGWSSESGFGGTRAADWCAQCSVKQPPRQRLNWDGVAS